MKHFHINKGLDLPLAGVPEQMIQDASEVGCVALTGPDYVGMKPTLHVKVGDCVKLGQLLFEDKRNPGVKFTSPASGVVREILRGEKRVFRQLLIECEEKEQSVEFPRYRVGELDSLDAEQVKSQLIESGLWTALRTRPFSRVPNPKSSPHSLFVNAMDTNPGAPSAEVILRERADDFINGLRVLSRICGKKIHLCKAPDTEIPGAEDSRNPLMIRDGGAEILETAVFEGPHPAGLSGTHIHFIDPVGGQKTVWYLGFQDVIAIGSLFTTGKLPVERIVSLSGPRVEEPVLLRTRLGACLNEVVEGKLKHGPNRVISGSVLSGRTALSDCIEPHEALPGLGRYHQQISVIAETVNPELFGWVLPGFRKFSLTRTLISSLLPRIPFPMRTGIMGGSRAVFPVSQFEQVMPLDIFPVFLFQALEVGDIERSEALGCLELDEEDLALCTFADPGKNDYGAGLRKMLDIFLKEELAAAVH